ncbi:MAG TPA: hypothetical protein VIM41_09625 [Gammaproteobacteria bacterium]
MIIVGIFGLILLGAIMYLNITSTQIIQSSHIHTTQKKRHLLLIVWCVPLAGVFIALYMINRDIKKNQQKMENDIAPAIRELSDKIRNIEAGLQQREKKPKFH